MTKVNLIVAGVQKGGTTTVEKHLRNHPSIAFGDTKELHVSSDNARFDDPAYDVNDAYPRRFANVVAVEGVMPRYLADATPIYCYWPNAIERLAAYNPTAKLILVFRDPVERAYSHWKMEYAKGNDTLSFPEAIRSGRSRVMSDPVAPGFHRVFSYVERGFYANQLRRVFSNFPRGQVLVLDNRMLSDDVEQTLSRVWNFLELDPPSVAPTLLRENTAFQHDYGYEFDQRDGEFLYRLFQYDIETFAELSGLDVSHWGAAYRNKGALAFADVLRERTTAFEHVPGGNFPIASPPPSIGLHEDATPFAGPDESERRAMLESECERLRSENEQLRAELAQVSEKPRRWFGR